MKITTLVLTVCIAFISCNNKKGSSFFGLKQPKIDSVFHIKAKFWYHCQWQVLFTNTNFYEEETIMDAYDISSIIQGNNVVHQLKIFKNESEAIAFAKKFKTYDMCRRWNDSVYIRYKQLLEYRSKIPVEKEPYGIKFEDCKDEEGKEVIVN